MEEFFYRALPDGLLILKILPVSVLYTLAAAWLAGFLKVKRGVKTSYTRKIFHFLIFIMAALLHYVSGLPAVMIFGTVVSIAVIWAVLAKNNFYEAIARETDAPHRALFVIAPLACTALGGAVSNLFFQDMALAGYLACGIGDAIAEPVGTKWGRHRYKVPSFAGVKAYRSLEGSFAVFAAASLSAAFAVYLIGAEPRQSLLIGLLCGAAGTIVEALSTHGTDNLTMQVAVSAVAYYSFNLHI